MIESVLGIHGFSASSDRPLHDTGASIVVEGKVIASVNEERLTRVKKDGSFPNNSIKEVFKISNIRPEDIDLVAMSDETPLWQLWNISKYSFKTLMKTGIFMRRYFKESLKRTKEFRRELPNNLKSKKVIFVEHHKAHAASAFFTSPYNQATIVTLDGMGDYCIGGCLAIGNNGYIEILKRTNGFYSPGIFYMLITSLLGFKPGHHEGKVTGLASYGDWKPAYAIMEEIISYDQTSNDFFSRLIPEAMNRFSLTQDEEYSLEMIRKKLDGYSKEEIASAAQKRLEDVVTRYIHDCIIKTGIRNIVLAGGIFGNVKLNQKIFEMDCVDGLYIHPAMNDSGLATGAALFSAQNNGFSKPKFLSNVFLGPEYSDKEILKTISNSGLKYSKIENTPEKIAEYIAEDYIVGHYHGRMEYGPRALGNRSILASAVDPTINSSLNQRLKRTEFMPFAPSILEEYADDYLHGYNEKQIASQFMTITYDVKDIFKRKAPAAVHVDGTARPQVVKKEDNPRFYDIIKKYHKKSDIPMVINTSFNMHEEPIICTPSDAIRAYKQGAVDVLVMNNFLVVKTP